MALVLMSKRELNRVEVLARLSEGRIDAASAAELIGVSERQVYRLLKAFKNGGAASLAHRHRGRRSNNRISLAIKDEVLALIRKSYADFGPTLAAEKLAERHGIKLSRETLRSWMTDAGIWLPRAERKRFHQPRHRREHVGELIQIDGSEHAWFEDRGPKCSLLVFIDDATSTLMELMFVTSESTFAYFDALERYVCSHGKPVAFYSDKHTIFRPARQEATNGSGITQFGRALSSLNIEILCANTSQAKGRVERAHKTLQDRLVKELRLEGIADIDAANAFLEGFKERYNARFAKPPANNKDLHRPLTEMDRLDDILCWRETRKVSRQLVVNYNRMKFTLEPNEFTKKLPGKQVEILDFPDGRLQIRAKGVPLAYTVFDKLQRVTHAAIVDNKRLGEVLAWIKKEQDKQPPDRAEKQKPRRSHQRAGIMKERCDRLAQSTG
jgi:transposase